MSANRKLVLTAILFAAGLGLVMLAGAVVHKVWPIFVAWIPLLAVPWVLTRPEPAESITVKVTEDETAEEPSEGEREPEPEPGAKTSSS